MEEQLPLTVSGADQEPASIVQLKGRPTTMMVDTGATYTCVGETNETHLCQSGKFLGQVKLIPMTAPVNPTIRNKISIPKFKIQNFNSSSRKYTSKFVLKRGLVLNGTSEPVEKVIEK